MKKGSRKAALFFALDKRGGRSTKQGRDISFSKRDIPPLNPPRENSIGSLQLEGVPCLPIALPCVAALLRSPPLVLRYDLPLLLLSAAALKSERKCSVITVYRGTHQCGERSNAAFRRQSAAEVTSLAPHGVGRGCDRSRLAEDSWRSHVHRTDTPQAGQSFKLQTANVRGRGGRPLAFLWGI